MIRMLQAQNRIADDHRFLFISIHEFAFKWIIGLFDYHPFSDPLPELVLSRPELLAVMANNQGVIFLSLNIFSLLLFFFLRLVHDSYTNRPWQNKNLITNYPKGKSRLETI